MSKTALTSTVTTLRGKYQEDSEGGGQRVAESQISQDFEDCGYQIDRLIQNEINVMLNLVE